MSYLCGATDCQRCYPGNLTIEWDAFEAEADDFAKENGLGNFVEDFPTGVANDIHEEAEILEFCKDPEVLWFVEYRNENLEELVVHVHCIWEKALEMHAKGYAVYFIDQNDMPDWLRKAIA